MIKKESGCRYKNECPSRSGWCDSPKEDFNRCIPFLITAYKNIKSELKAYKDTGLSPEQLLKIDHEYSVLAKEAALMRKERTND